MRVALPASVKDIYRAGHRSRLLASTAILLTALAAPPAFANDECGTGTFVVCTSAANPYSSGITYDPVTDLTLVVEGDVIITPGAGTGGIRVDSTGGTVDVTIEDGAYIAASAANGIVLSGAGETRLHMGGTMIVGYEAIEIIDAAGGVAVTLGGSIAATYGGGDGAYVRNTAGNVEIDVLGNNTIATTGLSSHGIFVDGAHNVSIDLAAGNMIEAEYGVGVAINGASDVAIQSHGTTEAGLGIFVSNSSGDVEILSSGPIEIYNAIPILVPALALTITMAASQSIRPPRSRVRGAMLTAYWSVRIPSRR